MNNRIALRDYRPDDLDAIFAWVNDPAIKDNFRFTAKPLTREDMQKFLDKQIHQQDSSYKHFVLYDISNENQNYIGSVGLKNIDIVNQNAELTIVISDSGYRGKGYGQEALKLICDYGFTTLHLHKLYLTCVSHNIGAIKSYEKFGFIHEGLRKEQIFQNGQFYDEVLMGKINKKPKF
jgi:RimJ/RimL family protein N-acetyltransferase